MAPNANSFKDYNGEPGCKTLEEVNRMFRNLFDPTSYWVCEEHMKPAKLKRCPQYQLFSDPVGKCVDYNDWEMTEPKEPPSRPK